MKLKYSGLTASGNTHPKFTRGDIYRDQYGGTVMIKGVAGRGGTYRRGGYEYDCGVAVFQFRRGFFLVQTAPHNVPPSNARARGNIPKTKTLINGIQGEKKKKGT
ncbi:DUF4222 domain-containing protein, partial [Escherichia coli]|uniref:DUF4222 domain-containing protein n=1 Tax=Escherichia coli TaxID=562 RepID=UPI00097F75F3